MNTLDQRRKAYDIFPQLVVPDEFMRRVEAQAEWTLVDPHEVREKLNIDLPSLWGDAFEEAYQQIEANLDDKITLYKKINARHLFKDVMRSTIETGMPYLWFKDTVNRANPNKHDGYIPSGNLCQESYSNVSPGKYAHLCNLSSLNLANIEGDDLAESCEVAVRLLDNTIEITTPPFTDARDHNQRYRTIGVGAMGLADWLAKRKLGYSDIVAIDDLFEDIGYHCTRASADLGRERGAYPAFEGSDWSKGLLIGSKELSWYQDNATDFWRWEQLSADIQKYGIRNSHITAIAPNTSSSLVQGCTASILPTYSKFFYDKWAKGTVPIAPPFIDKSFWYYQENKTLDQKIVIKAVSTMQKWIDTGISMEVIFNLNKGIYFDDDRPLNAKDIYEVLLMAWKEECKAIYYVRTVQKDDFKEEGGCASCAN